MRAGNLAHKGDLLVYGTLTFIEDLRLENGNLCE